MLIVECQIKSQEKIIMSLISMGYHEIRNQVIQKSSRCSVQELNTLKNVFEERINSTRRLDSIFNISELLNILEKRNVLKEQDLHCFQEIISVLNIELNFQCNVRNIDITSPRQENDVLSRQCPIVNSEEIYDLICTEIGIKWKDFARALRFSDGKIEELHDKYRTISERIRQVLIYNESRYTSTTWTWVPLLEALSKSRRNDLRNKIQEMISM